MIHVPIIFSKVSDFIKDFVWNFCLEKISSSLNVKKKMIQKQVTVLYFTEYWPNEYT